MEAVSLKALASVSPRAFADILAGPPERAAAWVAAAADHGIVDAQAVYGQYLLDKNRPRYALAIGQRLFTHKDVWTDPGAITLLLNATARVWGVDSVLATARRLHAVAPSARSSLFIGLSYETLGDSTAALAAYRDGLRTAPGDSALAARTAALSHSQ